QRQPREDAKPVQHVVPKPKAAEAAKPKDDKPDDTLKLLQSSTAIQTNVTVPAQAESVTQTQTTTAEAVGDVLAKSTAKAVSPPLTGVLAASETPAGATGAATTDTTQSTPVANVAPAKPVQDAASQIAQLLQPTTAEKPAVDSAVTKTPTP